MEPSIKNRKIYMEELVKSVDLSETPSYLLRRNGLSGLQASLNLEVYKWWFEELNTGNTTIFKFFEVFIDSEVGSKMMRNLRATAIDGFPISQQIIEEHLAIERAHTATRFYEKIDNPLDIITNNPYVEEFINSSLSGQIETANWFSLVTLHSIFYSGGCEKVLIQLLNRLDERRLQLINSIIKLIISRFEGKEPESIVLNLWSNPFFKGNYKELEKIAEEKKIAYPENIGIAIVVDAASHLYSIEKLIKDTLPIYTILSIHRRPPSVPRIDIDRFTNEQILNAVKIPGRNRVYLIGSYDKRITIYNEQVRALRICRAIIEENIISTDSSIAIVGGGIAGVTCAVSLLSKGFKIVLFEKKDELINIQSKSNHRYVHPHIFSWPDKGSNWTYAGIPIDELDWEAGFADEVSLRIKKQSMSFFTESDNIDIRLNTNINCISETSNGRVELDIESSKPEVFDTIILTVGFGDDNQLTTQTVGYWEQDNLAAEEETLALVSGRGDGALIDAIRCIMHEFDHKELIKEFSTKSELLELGRKVKEQDDIAREHNLRVLDFDLYEACTLIPIEHSIIESFKHRMIKDCEVILLHRNKDPFKYDTAIINRVALLILEKIGVLQYMQGELIDVNNSKSGKKAIRIQNQNGTSTIEVDKVVARHGPTILRTIEESIGNHLFQKSSSLSGVISAIGITDKLDIVTDEFFQK